MAQRINVNFGNLTPHSNLVFLLRKLGVTKESHVQFMDYSMIHKPGIYSTTIVNIAP